MTKDGIQCSWKEFSTKILPQTPSKSRLEKKQYLNAQRGNIVHKSYPKHRFKLLSRKKQKKYRNARQKVSNKKAPQKTVKNIATQKRQNRSVVREVLQEKVAQKTVKTCQKKGRIVMLSMKYRTQAKTRSQEKTVLNYSS